MSLFRNLGLLPMVVLFALGQVSWAQDFKGLKKQLIDGDRAERREAALALRELGDSALPALPELIEALADDDEQVAGRAVMAVASIGPNAPDAIPALIEQLDPRRRRYDEQVVFRTAFALGKIGEASVEPLRKALKSSSDRRRHGAAQALQLIGAEAAPAVPELIDALKDREDEVRLTAAEALAAIGEPALKPLREKLSADPSVAAVRALGLLGKTAAGASDQLLALNSKDDAVSAAVIVALGSIGVPLAKLENPLREAIQDESEVVRIAAAGVLLGRDDSLPVLKRWLADSQKGLQQRAAWVVGQFGADAAELAPDLIRQLEGGDDSEVIVKALAGLGAGATAAILDSVGKESVEALRKGEEPHWAIVALRSAGPLAMPQLEAAIGSESAATRFAALDSLAALGRVTADLEPKFRKATSDSEPAVRLAALIALDASGADSSRLVNILHRRCADDSGEVRAVAVRLLGAIGDEDRGAFKFIDQALADPNDAVRKAAIGALVNFGSDGQASVPRILELASGADAETRLLILNALAAIGGGAGDALSFVRRSLDDQSANLRGAAINALVAIEPDGENLTALLAKMLTDKDKAVRHPAIEGLGKRGESAASAAPKLFELLESGEDRAEVLEALRQIRSKDVELYVGALKNREPRVRLFACEALGRLGKEAEEAIPALEKAKRDRYDFVRRRADDAIRRIKESS